MYREEILTAVKIITTTFLFVVFITPFIKKLANAVKAIDIPRGRHKHPKPTPKFGGLAIFGGFILGFIIFGNKNSAMISILIGSFIIILTGMIDDIYELPALLKFFGQLISALIIVFYGNFLISNINIFNITINFGIIAYPITIFFILGSINCINFIDGLDGLASGISAIYFLTIAIICIIQGKLGIDFIISLIMFGSILGFLMYNFSPASIFAGDSGAMFMGYMISVTALLGFKNVTLTSLIVPVIIIAIPILDVLFAIIRRTLKGEKITKPDRYHIHHILLKQTISERTTVIIIYIINLLFSFASILHILENKKLGTTIYILLTAIIITFIFKTEIIIKKNK